MRPCCCHKASWANEWCIITWSECVMTWWSTPLVDDVGDGLRLTEPPPMLLAPGDFGPPSSSFHLSMERRRAFMKKLPTVVGSSPNCLAIVTCISLDGRFVSCNKKMQLAHLIPSFNDCMLFFFHWGIRRYLNFKYEPWKWPVAYVFAGQWRPNAASWVPVAAPLAVALLYVCTVLKIEAN